MRGCRGSVVAHVAIDAVNHIPRRKVWNLWVGVGDVVGKDLDKRLPFLLRLAEHRV